LKAAALLAERNCSGEVQVKRQKEHKQHYRRANDAPELVLIFDAGNKHSSNLNKALFDVNRKQPLSIGQARVS